VKHNRNCTNIQVSNMCVSSAGDGKSSQARERSTGLCGLHHGSPKGVRSRPCGLATPWCRTRRARAVLLTIASGHVRPGEEVKRVRYVAVGAGELYTRHRRKRESTIEASGPRHGFPEEESYAAHRPPGGNPRNAKRKVLVTAALSVNTKKARQEGSIREG
jgi:hypothetical protein